MNIIQIEPDSATKNHPYFEKLFLANREVTLSEIEIFLESLSNEQNVLFHDQFYPSHPEDPDQGAYVFIEREDEAFRYEYGNGHWSSKNTYQSVKFLAAYILINANSERFDGQPFTLEIRRNPLFTRKKTNTETPIAEENIEKGTFFSKLFGLLKN